MGRDLDLDAALDTARRAADSGAAIAMKYFGSRLAVEHKDDASPVTVADREAEQAIRAIIARAFPDHAVYGEEFGRAGEHPCLWLVDPIDGTRSFIRGLEFWSVQIALMVDGEIVLGVSAAPAFGEVARAVRDTGAWLNDRRLEMHEVTRIEDADLSLGNIRGMTAGKTWERLGGIVRRAARVRGYGDFYAYHRLAAGGLDAVIESEVNILDIAALSVIVREAGGCFTDLAGNQVGLDTSSALAATPRLHASLLSCLNE